MKRVSRNIGCEGERQENGRGHEEEGRGHFRSEEAQRRVGESLRCEDCASHRGYEEDLGVHQEVS